MLKSPISHKIRYLPEIDGLRAIAILGVVFYHLKIPGMSGGFVGVDVFFVISGFLITRLLAQEWEREHRVSLTSFYARRVLRLLPALITILVFTLLASRLLLLPSEQRSVYFTGTAAAFLYSNEYLRASLGSYFSSSSDHYPLLHIWSLSLEEQFYLFWPWLWILFAPLRVRGLQVLWMVLFGVLFLSLLLSEWLARTNLGMSYFSLVSRAWELSAGGVLVLLQKRFAHRQLNPTAEQLAISLGIGLILYSYIFLNRNVTFPGLLAIIPVSGSLLVLSAIILSPPRRATRFLRNNILVQIGLLSYGWYLWHWPLLVLTRSVRHYEASFLCDAAIGVLSLAMAAGTYSLIEKPAKLKLSQLSSDKIVAVGGLGLASVVVLAFILFISSESTRFSALPQEAIQLDLDHWNLSAKCNAKLKDSQDLRPLSQCVYGNTPSGQILPATAVWGDSHANSMLPLWDEVAKTRHFSFLQATRQGCPPILLNDANTTLLSKVSPDCYGFNRLVALRIKSLASKGLTSVTLIAHWSAYLDESANPTDFRNQINSTLDFLKEQNIRVAILLPTPVLTQSLPVCLSWSQPVLNCGISKAKFEQQRFKANKLLQELAAQYTNVEIVDLSEHFCNKGMCGVQLRTGAYAFFDDSHIANSAARQLAPAMYSVFNWMLEPSPQ